MVLGEKTERGNNKRTEMIKIGRVIMFVGGGRALAVLRSGYAKQCEWLCLLAVAVLIPTIFCAFSGFPVAFLMLNCLSLPAVVGLPMVAGNINISRFVVDSTNELRLSVEAPL